MASKWEKIDERKNENGYIIHNTWRLAVPGGWLYMIRELSAEDNTPNTIAMCFVPGSGSEYREVTTSEHREVSRDK